MRKPIIAANWKMYKTRAEAAAFCEQFLPLVAENNQVETVIFAPNIQLDVLQQQLAHTRIGYGAQNFYPVEEGAYTGEVSLSMLQELGVGYVIIGHSERRGIFGENDLLIQRKVEKAYEAGVQPILCVGESLEQREAGETITFCVFQMLDAIANIPAEQVAKLIVAYEPIWAIGTGKTASAQDAESVISQLRMAISQKYGEEIAQQVRIQYGGSVKPENIAELMSQPNIDGALVGGASLKAASLAQLINYPQQQHKAPVVLMVLDGWGISSEYAHNAIMQANTPHYDRILKTYPHSQLLCSGEAVGLPEGQQGNSEVGHLNLGAGRVVYQELTRITKALQEDGFSQIQPLVAAMEYCKQNKKPLHLMGLVSSGGVHSHSDHLIGLLTLAKKHGLEQVYLHCFLDGRDVPPASGAEHIKQLQRQLEIMDIGTIVTIMGRYYAMDRDNRWDRIEQAYNAMVDSKGVTAIDPVATIEQWYSQGTTDEFIPPTVIVDANEVPKGSIQAEDGVVFFNFRADRARELTRAFVQKDFGQFNRSHRHLHFVTMTQYEEGLDTHVAFAPQNLTNTLGAVLAAQCIPQFRIAETEKYAHVTFFFNGGIEHTNYLEERLLVPSPKVATYDLQPEMSAQEVVRQLKKALQKNRYQFILINLANADMVGHTGKLPETIKAIEVLDQCLGEVMEATIKAQATLFITADHGNAEKMYDEEKESAHTAHTANTVPFIVVSDKKYQLLDGKLCDVAPSVLQLLQIKQPEEMTGHSLLQ